MGRGGEIGGGFCHWEELGLGFRGGVGERGRGERGQIWVERERERGVEVGEKRESGWVVSDG